MGLRQEDLPQLLTRAEICAKMLENETDRLRKKDSVEDVVNPPPTPETDCHENDNSCDGIDNLNQLPEAIKEHNSRKVESYEDDFIDMTCGNDMDLF